MATHSIVSASFTCAAGTPTVIYSGTNLARNYSRIDIALGETGAVNATTACSWEVGTGTVLKRDAVTEAVVLDVANLGAASGEYTDCLDGLNVPDALRITLTSGAGNTIRAEIRGTTRG